MTETPTASTSWSRRDPAPTPGSAWTGWLVFAGMILIVIGAFQIIQGLVAIFQHDYYAVSRNGLVVHASYTGWGWLMLIIAVTNVFGGIGVLKGHTWARIWALASAGLSLVANIGFTNAFPVWSIMIVTLDVVIMYALCVHWDEMRQD
jgi:uncharacterized membrane-anchored protein